MIKTLVAVVAAAGLATGCADGAPSGSPAPRPAPTASVAPGPTISPAPSATVSPTPPPSSPPSSPPGSTPAAIELPAWLRGGVVTQLPVTERVVALTFDGGSGAQGAAAILAALSAARVRATFFLTGDFVRRNPATVAAIVRGGHVIGNHTMTHPHVTALSTALLRSEIGDTAARIEAASGSTPRPWFRFPYGEYDAQSLRLVHAMGYGAIGWTVDTLGWKGAAAGTVSDVVSRVLRARRPGEIVLMHLGANPDDGTTYDAAALPSVIAGLRQAGYRFVALTSSISSQP